MSETIKRFPSLLKLQAVPAQEGRSVVLPFPQPDAAPEPVDASAGDVAPLVRKLCERLNEADVSYCHWKSNWKLDRWLRSEGDLDLLVATSDANRFNAIAGELGFVQAVSSSNVEPPGIHHLYSWDDQAEKFVHLHAYYKLLVGHDLTTNYHLPLEEMLLHSTSLAGPMPVPEPELELLVFVLRKVLANWTTESLLRRLSGRSNDSRKTAAELAHLEARCDRARVYQLLEQAFPGLTISFFEGCVNSLRPGSSPWHRAAVRSQLQRFLAAHARRHASLDALVKTWRMFRRIIGDQFGASGRGRRFEHGGLLIALVGGDGSGKTTAIKSIDAWLSQNFAVKTFHFGKPRRSPITLAVIVALRGTAVLQRLVDKLWPTRLRNHTPAYPNSLRMFRWVCAGRDRLNVFHKARRFADSGGIAICDRYVVSGIFLMDGPNIPRTTSNAKLRGLQRAFLNAEARSYQQITQPDLLLVLRVDPETAVRRKTTEKEDHVRTRSTEVWQHDWSNSRARVIDANAPVEVVQAQLRAEIWRHI